jgi:hypothetical protein
MLCHPWRIKLKSKFKAFKKLDDNCKDVSGQSVKIKKDIKEKMNSKQFKNKGIYDLTYQSCNKECPYHDECRAENKEIFKSI